MNSENLCYCPMLDSLIRRIVANALRLEFVKSREKRTTVSRSADGLGEQSKLRS